MDKIIKYRVRNTGEFLDGLVVGVCDSSRTQTAAETVLWKVLTVEQPSQLFRTFSIPTHGLWIDASKLEKYDPPEAPAMTDNPFGKFMHEGRLDKDGFTVTWALYTRALTVSVKERGKSVYVQNFLNDDTIDSLRTKFADWAMAEDDELIIDDVIWELQSYD